MTPDDYLNWIIPAAQRVCAQYNLPYAVVVGQGAIESQWGTYKIGQYNIFGRKWGGWGNYIEQETQECYNGVWQTIVDKFQDYDSMDQAINDWCVLITQEPVYVNALQGVDTSDAVAIISAIGPVYATDPDYAAKVIQTMRACDLV